MKRHESTPKLEGSNDAPLNPTRAPSGVVLVVEKQSEIRGLLRYCLEQQGYAVVEAARGREGIEAAIQSRPNAVLLDLDVPDMDGITVLQRVREWSRSFILVLSESGDEPRKLRAFDNGANDFLTRPFSMAELTARLRAAQRFAPPSAPEVFRSGDLSVDLANRTVKVGDRTVNLSATEYSLLQLFIRNAGKVLTHAQILREVWGPRMVSKLEYLRVYLKFLREKLERNPTQPELFLTERSVGYRLAILEG